jgi:hypothetical protein
MWKGIKILTMNRRLLDGLLAVKPKINRMMNIRYISWLLVAGAASTLIVLVVQTTRHVSVVEATHLGFVELGHSHTADGITEISNTAPAGGLGRALQVHGSGQAGGEGLYAVGHGRFGHGVLAFSYDAQGVVGIAVPISGNATNGVSGISSNPNASGVYGENNGEGFGVAGRSSGTGVYGEGQDSGVGVYGVSTNNDGVHGVSTNNNGVYGFSSSTYAGFFTGASGQAGYFNGNVDIAGTLTKGAGSFKIDHPLDPANKYLSHSFVESPDMKTIYDGVVVLDAKGEASVELPAWFEALNRDFRYQLTAIGASAPNLYIAQKISKNCFSIAGGLPGLEVSWQVTGIRHDPYADQHRLPVEEQKSTEERGKYLYPKEYGQPETVGLYYEDIQKMQQHQADIRKHREEMVQRESERRKYYEEMVQRESERRKQ